MRQKGRTTILEERIEIGERWEAGQTDPEIAKAMDRSVGVVRKWRRKYQREGRAGLASHMGRPPTGALGSFPEPVRKAIREMREENPGWGPDTIRAEWDKDPTRKGLPRPSRSRIAAFLNEEGYTRPYERHTELAQPEKENVEEVHEEWEMDAQGVINVSALGQVSIINAIDVRSRLKVESFPCLDTSHPNTKDYQLVLRRAFLQYGLPERISLDHDSVFYDNASPSPFPTTIHLWLIALGIEVRFIEDPPPTEHNLIERTHQTMYQQAVADQTFTDGGALEVRLTERRHFLNYDFPTEALDDRAPLEAYPEAVHSGTPYRPEWEEAMLDLERVYDYLARGRWFRRTSAQGQFSIGAQRYNAGKDFAEQQLEITFDSQTRELVCRSEDGESEIRFSIQGLNKSNLMGELAPMVTLPVYQLALPFTPESWREMMLCGDLTGTTL
jgi:transposase